MSTSPPLCMATGEHHRATADVMVILTTLAAAGGVLSTSRLARLANVHRDSTRRILRELETAGWVRRIDDEQGENWTIGPELPRLGLHYQQRLVEAQRQLAADFQRASAPLEST